MGTALPARLRHLADARFKRGEIGGGQDLKLAAEYIEALEGFERMAGALISLMDHEVLVARHASARLRAVRERIGG